MKTFYVQIEDCQNNPIAVVKVKAKDLTEAKYKALCAIHAEDNIYIVDEDDVIAAQEDGMILIDENGEETEI